MGTPLPPLPPDPGDLCTTCWGESSPFGLVTPRVISIQLFDLEEGEFWDEAFREELFTPTDLIQSEFSPCFFANVTTFFQWFIEYGPVSVNLVVDLNFFPNRDAFFNGTIGACLRSGANGIVDGGGVVAFNGTFSIYLGVP